MIVLKKILFSLLLVMSVFLPLNVSAEEVITIYLFRGETCHYCEEALDYINENQDLIPDNVEIVTYEVWNNSNNATLMDQVADNLEIDKTSNYGTPLFIVGSKYSKGYGSDTWETLFSYATSYLEDGEYEDVVAATIRDLGIDVEALGLDDLYREPNQVVTIVVYCIFGLIVVGFIVMIAFSRKKR